MRGGYALSPFFGMVLSVSTERGTPAPLYLTEETSIPLNMLSAYDFRDHPELVRIAEGEFAPLMFPSSTRRTTIQNGCLYGNFRANMQVPRTLNPEQSRTETRRLGEVRRSWRERQCAGCQIASAVSASAGP